MPANLWKAAATVSRSGAERGSQVRAPKRSIPAPAASAATSRMAAQSCISRS